MPDQKQSRETTHERNLARRVQRERERRGMSYEALANAVTEAGCPMHPSAAFKIEKGDPPRRITVDEFVALSEVFGLSLDDLLLPAEVAENEEIRALMDRYRDVLAEVDEPARQLGRIVQDLSERLGGVEPATEALLAYITQKDSGRTDLPGLGRSVPGRSRG